MFGPNAKLRTLSAILMIGLMAISAFADTIRLKDGSIIKGKITTFSDGRFVVVIGEGGRRRELSFSAADVESVAFDSQPASNRASSSQSAAVKTPPKVIVSDASNSDTKPKSSEPVAERSDEPIVDRPQVPVNTTPIRKASSAKPIEVSVKVMADNTANGWTNSGWVVKKGQKIRISGSGEISLGGGKMTQAGGLYDIEDESKLLKAVPTGALIAVIGDDNNDFIYIGTSREFVAARDGALFLGVNEGNLNDNSGAFEVKIEIEPSGE